MKKQNIFPVSKVETNDTLKELSRERETLYFRLAIIPTGDEETLTKEQKEMLSKLGETAKAITLKGQLTREISNIFPANILSDYIEGIDKVTADMLDDEMQEDLIGQISDILKAEKGFIFTYYTFSISDLLKDTDYKGIDKLYTENGSVVRQRNNLYFGFFDDEEEAFSFMRGRLIDAIESGDLTESAPEATTPKAEEEKVEKPKLNLRRK